MLRKDRCSMCMYAQYNEHCVLQSIVRVSRSSSACLPWGETVRKLRGLETPAASSRGQSVPGDLRSHYKHSTLFMFNKKISYFIVGSKDLTLTADPTD